MTLHGQVPSIVQIAGYSYVQNAEAVAINVQSVKNIACIKNWRRSLEPITTK